MRTEHHIFQSNGDKQRGFGCLVSDGEERVREARAEVSSKEAFCQEVPEVSLSNLYRVSRAKQTSLCLCMSTHTHITCSMTWNLFRMKGEGFFNRDQHQVCGHITLFFYFTSLLADVRLATVQQQQCGSKTTKPHTPGVKLLDNLSKSQASWEQRQMLYKLRS